jgi:hypothetical protein
MDEELLQGSSIQSFTYKIQGNRMSQRYNKRSDNREARSLQECVPMKIRALLLSSILALTSLSVSALAQDDKQKTQPSDQSTQTQPKAADQSTSQQTPSQSSGDVTQAPPATATSSDDQANSSDQDSDKKDKKEQKIKHDGSKKDVDAIGNRKLGGMDWYSTESEIKMGKQYAQQIEQSMKLIQDPVVNEYVNRVGQNLVRNSDAKVPFTIKVVDADEINAMALPGGFFYVNSGLILAADGEAELAGVMAHEIAHVCARHATRGATRGQLANIMTIPLIFVGGGIGYAAREAAGIGLPLTFLSFSRGFEAEADYLGVQYMYKAGYDPNEFVNFFEKIQAQEKKKPGSLAKAFSTHPQTPDRIQKTQEEIATILPGKEQYIETTSEFNDVKSRLASLENRRKIDDTNPNKPTLRRTASTSKDKNTNGDQKDDDRPTLKRRDN